MCFALKNLRSHWIASPLKKKLGEIRKKAITHSSVVDVIKLF